MTKGTFGLQRTLNLYISYLNVVLFIYFLFECYLYENSYFFLPLQLFSNGSHGHCIFYEDSVVITVLRRPKSQVHFKTVDRNLGSIS